MMLVEIIMGKQTGDNALADALDYVRAIKKTPIVVNDARGFFARSGLQILLAVGLFFVWGGGNDFMDGQTNPSIPASNLANHITTLASAGAVSFVVPNLPPLGQIPRYRGTANEAVMDSRSRQFNALLDSHVQGLRGSLGISIFHLDVEFLFEEMLAAAEVPRLPTPRPSPAGGAGSLRSAAT
jgi:hypothetical protein